MPNWTNDLDAMGRVCSALPGAMADGMEAPRARHNGPALAYGAPAIPESERPRRRQTPWPVAPSHGDRRLAYGPIHEWAGVGAAGAERAEGRSGAPSGAGKPARRSGAQSGA
ncbi:hypothetical protein GCM10009646_26960 [Streptomyces aureus]